MDQKCFDEKASISERFKQRKKLLKPFLEKYKNPVIVHSVDQEFVFKKILSEGILKLPNKHNSRKKTPFMESILGIDCAIYYSLGFVYSTAFGWKYNLLFDLGMLNKCKYYKNSVNYQCYLSIVDYWYENDKKYFEKLRKLSSNFEKVLDKYLNEKYEGKTRKIFEFWKIEKELYNQIQKYTHKKVLYNLIHKTANKLLFSSEKGFVDAKDSINKDKAPEIVGLNDNKLFLNPNFLGFYIKGEFPKELLKIMKEKYSDKILFDGKKIKKISELN